jgi:starch phosphorylase
MARLTPHFSACRTVQEYTEEYYIPAAINYAARSRDPNFATEYSRWDKVISETWPQVRFERLIIDTRRGFHFFCAHIFLNQLDPALVKMTLYCNENEELEMKLVGPVPGAEKGSYAMLGHVADTRPASDFTPRVTPFYRGLSVPLEENRIIWQR